MRIDKYLHRTHLVKRRSVAQELISDGSILINQKRSKPSAQIKVGDIINLKLGKRKMMIEITEQDEQILKRNKLAGYKVLSETINE